MNLPFISGVKRLVLILPFSLATWMFSTGQNLVLHPASTTQSIVHDISPPLLGMPVLQSDTVESRKRKEVPNPNYSLIFEKMNVLVEAEAERDPVLQSTEGTLSPNSTILNIDGINNPSGYVPPDPAGEVGANHYIQAVNTSFAIYSKTGDLLYGPASLGTIWQGFPGQHTSDGDPIVLYDHLADRWLVSQFSLPNYPNGPFYELIAISQTSDPLGSWHRYAFQFSDMPDYPKLAVWPDGYYMSTRRFASGSTNWLGPGAVVFERDSMLAGNTARMSQFELPSSSNELFPADIDGQLPPTGSPGYFLSEAENLSGGGDRLEIFRLFTDWTDPSSAVFTGPDKLSTESFDRTMCGSGSGCIPQAGSTQRLDALSRYLMNRVQYRNFDTYEAIVANGTVDADNTNHAGIRWYELRNIDSAWSIYQQGTYAPDTNHRWIGSIAMDGSGNIALAYSVSGKGMYPSIRATARKFGDTPGLMTYQEESIMEGAGAQTDPSSRWGDYSCLTIDPVDDRTFWYTNEYYASTSGMDWRTRIASFTIDDFPVDTKEMMNAEPNSLFNLKNYPNPVESSTVISWQLEIQSRVKLTIYDFIGKKIKTIADQFQAPGYHQAVFEASGFSAGVYYYQICADGKIETKKMIILK
jgi:hypothetical protein